MFSYFCQVTHRTIRGIDRPMGKVVSFQQRKSGRAGGIATILAAMGVAGAAGYFGPGFLDKLPLPNGVQLVARAAQK